MKINQAGIDLIKHFEGLYLEAYYCPSGVLTVGYGTTGDRVTPGLVITEAQAQQWLAEDLAYFENAVTKLVKVPLNDNQFSALVSFAYNCGEGALSGSTALRRLNGGDYAGCCEALQWWNKGANDDVLPGLVRRRKAEVDLFNTPVTPSNGQVSTTIPLPVSNSASGADPEDLPGQNPAPIPTPSPLNPSSRPLKGGKCDIRTQRDTWFKLSSADPTQLSDEQKVLLPVKTIFPVLAWREVEVNHLIITLNGVTLKGYNTWYVSLNDVVMRLPKSVSPETPQEGSSDSTSVVTPPSFGKHKLIFTMNLADADDLIVGKLKLIYPDGKAIDYLATSGCCGYQSKDCQWTIARGPVPEGFSYQIPTTPYWSDVKGVEGNFFHITPDPITSQDGVQRGEFGIHHDANVPGSSGCIVIENSDGFQGFCDRMKKISASGVDHIDLEVKYS